MMREPLLYLFVVIVLSIAVFLWAAWMWPLIMTPK